MKIDRKAFKKILTDKDINQQVISDLLNLHKATLSHRLNNGSTFPDEQIKLISDFLEVDPAKFTLNHTMQFQESEQTTIYMTLQEENALLKNTIADKEEIIHLLKAQLAQCREGSEKERQLGSR